jgi:peptidoglycan DL-endopeptidase CwlO
VEHVRPRRYVPSGQRNAHLGPGQGGKARHAWQPGQGGRPGHTWRAASIWRRAAIVMSAAGLASLVLPSGVGGAARGEPMPSLQSLIARAKILANEINSLNQQYDGLQIQLTQARDEAKVSQRTYTGDLARLGAGKLAVGQLAAQSYMTGGMDTPLELLTTSTPKTIISRGAFMQELQEENGDRVSQIAEAVAAAERARATAQQQSKRAAQLSAEMAGKKRQAQSKINILNSAVFARAMAVFDRTGRYPDINLPTANTIGAQALRWALSRVGDEYVWGGAGPNVFDCSGLVMWAYAQVGISLPHYTVSQFNMGIHVSRSQLEPGDLVFFYADIGHVGMYIGKGLMVDAPTFGQPVQVQPVMWAYYVGAVRIVG